jgi:hypothetical protein
MGEPTPPIDTPPNAESSAVSISFDDATAAMRTGDVVLMHGTFPASRLIQWVERSKWTHSGVIIRPEDVGLDGTDVLFYESNSTPLPDIRFGTTKPGPMVGTLRARVDDAVSETYDMEFAWRSLDADRSSGQAQRIWDLMPATHHAGFPSDLGMALFVLLGRVFRTRTPKSSIYCAELVAMAYQAAGWLDPTAVPNGFEPTDFSTDGSITLLDGATLTTQQEFDPPLHP